MNRRLERLEEATRRLADEAEAREHERLRAMTPEAREAERLRQLGVAYAKLAGWSEPWDEILVKIVEAAALEFDSPEFKAAPFASFGWFVKMFLHRPDEVGADPDALPEVRAGWWAAYVTGLVPRLVAILWWSVARSGEHPPATETLGRLLDLTRVCRKRLANVLRWETFPEDKTMRAWTRAVRDLLGAYETEIEKAAARAAEPNAPSAAILLDGLVTWSPPRAGGLDWRLECPGEPIPRG